jgi:two-component system, NtrC family, response regulator HydG
VGRSDDLPDGLRPQDVSILVVDDDEAHAEAMAESLARIGYLVDVANGGRAGQDRIEAGRYDIVLTDLVMADVDGMQILEAAKTRLPDCGVILVTGHASVETAVKALQKGAATYLHKPLNIDEVRAVVHRQAEQQRLRRQNEELRKRLDDRYGFEEIIGESPEMIRIFRIMRQISDTTATVLITGESGTGKELIARALHENGRRRNAAFVAINCAALGEGVLESELFGHEKGAFTGAVQKRKGRFEHANRGTLFLDEVGDMPMSIQIKLLRVIEQREIERVGSNEPIPVDVRLVAATNQDLETLVKAGTFREDLYFRLQVIQIRLPGLRERRSDITLMIDVFLAQLAAQHDKRVTGITPEARRRLVDYDWPGNVRELRNALENMVVIAQDEILDVNDIPPHIVPGEGDDEIPVTPQPGTTLEDMERRLIRDTLAAMGGNRQQAAGALGISERTLYRKIKSYGL